MSRKQIIDPGTEERNVLSEAARLMGKRGGPAAAKARFAKMSPEQRSEFGRRLVAKRWRKNIQVDEPLHT